MRCVVLGGTGFIGSHLVPRLVEMGYEVTVFGRRQPFQPLSGVRYLQGDWRDSAILGDALENAALVYHFIWG
ncbi:MAG: NAD-dependent epimerase/dehydratase family protein, partial [Anaerolineae bacterium]|nr:NAD-dependent epimerase/dehydratase family protein [Anaerolineae bacterium]